MAGVFLSYRRQDSDYAVLLYAWLDERFGPAQVFWDDEDIDPGKEFRRVRSICVAVMRWRDSMADPNASALTLLDALAVVLSSRAPKH